MNQRPKKLGVFINPIGGSQNSLDVYSKVVYPLFKAANIKCDVNGKYIHNLIHIFLSLIFRFVHLIKSLPYIKKAYIYIWSISVSTFYDVISFLCTVSERPKHMIDLINCFDTASVDGFVYSVDISINVSVWFELLVSNDVFCCVL